MKGLVRGSVAIVGAAESDIGAVASLMSPIDLMAQGIARALDDAGLSLSDVDGVFCATTQARTSAMSLLEYLGLPDAYTDSTIVGGVFVRNSRGTRPVGVGVWCLFGSR